MAKLREDGRKLVGMYWITRWLRWLLSSPKKPDQVYAEEMLKSIFESELIVQHLLQLEAANVLLSAGKHKELENGEAEHFIAQLESPLIQVDSLADHQAYSNNGSCTAWN